MKKLSSVLFLVLVAVSWAGCHDGLHQLNLQSTQDINEQQKALAQKASAEASAAPSIAMPAAEPSASVPAQS